jgi:hypothetical protein
MVAQSTFLTMEKIFPLHIPFSTTAAQIHILVQ